MFLNNVCVGVLIKVINLLDYRVVMIGDGVTDMEAHPPAVSVTESKGSIDLKWLLIISSNFHFLVTVLLMLQIFVFPMLGHIYWLWRYCCERQGVQGGTLVCSPLPRAS